MKIIYQPRQSGKTTELIRMCAEGGGYIVTHSYEAARAIFEQAKKMEVSIPFPLTFDEFLNRKYFPLGAKQIYIDNAEFLLQHLSPCPVVAITMTKSATVTEAP